jgi:hypothetical protein
MDVTTATAHLDAWLAADLALARGQSYAIGDRTLTRTDGAHVKERIAYWQGVINSLNAEAAGNKAPSIRVATWT